MLEDALHKLGHDATDENKIILHKFHKEVLGVKSIAGVSHDKLSEFLLNVSIYWAERGIFIRTSGKQEWGMEDRPLSELWDKL